MSRDIERARDGKRTAPAIAPDGLGDAEPEPEIADRPPAPAPARSRLPAIPADPDLLHYRNRLDQQLAAWREGRSGTSLATIATAPAPGFGWRGLLTWTVPVAACAVAASAGWWLASAPAMR